MSASRLVDIYRRAREDGRDIRASHWVIGPGVWPRSSPLPTFILGLPVRASTSLARFGDIALVTDVCGMAPGEAPLAPPDAEPAQGDPGGQPAPDEPPETDVWKHAAREAIAQRDQLRETVTRLERVLDSVRAARDRALRGRDDTRAALDEMTTDRDRWREKAKTRKRTLTLARQQVEALCDQINTPCGATCRFAVDPSGPCVLQQGHPGFHLAADGVTWREAK